MDPERKSVMVSVRLPKDLVARVDFVVRNSDMSCVKNRSTALHGAVRAWLKTEEQRLVALGLTPPKKAG